MSKQGIQQRKRGKRMSRRKKRVLRAAVVLTALVLVAALVAGGWWALGRLGVLRAKSSATVAQPASVLAPVGRHVPLLPRPLSVETPEGVYGLTEIGGQSVSFTLETRDGVSFLALNGHEMIFVNREYTVPRDYGDGVTPEAQAAYDAMIGAAADAGHTLGLVSGFRSYATQESIHTGYLNSGNWTYDEVKEMSAEPGHSEHQLGLAFDISDNGSLYRGFGDTDAGRWLAEHAAQYGFIIRYPEDKLWATGYTYEPWHFRYVGAELAQLISSSGLTVEEIIGQPYGLPPQ